jgi:hypothetical protein
MSDAGGTNEAGWKPDPDGRHEYRYWDGTTWSDQVSDSGVVSTDAPGPSAPAGDPTVAVPTQDPTAVVPPAGDQPPYVAPSASPYPPGTPVPGMEPTGRSKVPVGLLALVGLVVAALVAGIVIVTTGGDDGGSDDGEDIAVSSDDVTDDASDDLTDDASDDSSGDFSDDSSDDFTVDLTDEFTDDFSDDATADPDGDVAANLLRVGDCVEDQATLNSADVAAIPCGQPHVFELIGRFDVSGSAFPGDAALDAQGEQRCTAAIFEDYIGVPYAQSEIYASGVAPSEETWSLGDRTILCFAHTQALESTTGSVEGANR